MGLFADAKVKPHKTFSTFDKSLTLGLPLYCFWCERSPKYLFVVTLKYLIKLTEKWMVFMEIFRNSIQYGSSRHHDVNRTWHSRFYLPFIIYVSIW